MSITLTSQLCREPEPLRSLRDPPAVSLALTVIRSLLASQRTIPRVVSVAVEQGWTAQEGAERVARGCPWPGAPGCSHRSNAGLGIAPEGPIPIPATTGTRPGKSFPSIFSSSILKQVRLFAVLAACQGFVVHQKCRVCLFFSSGPGPSWIHTRDFWKFPVQRASPAPQLLHESKPSAPSQL